MTRTIYERDTDALFARVLRQPKFAAFFLGQILSDNKASIRLIEQQSPHAAHSGTIDLDILLDGGQRLLIENKIDAGYSVTRDGVRQPERYAATVAALRRQGVSAVSVLLAPQVYLAGSQHAAIFDRSLSYEALRPELDGEDLALIDAAIEQAEAPYEPAPNNATADFFAAITSHVARHWPHLVIKRNPNGNGIRPSGSNTIYFDVPQTLRRWPDIPKPRMSLQCRDLAAPSASVKIMIGRLGPQASRLSVPHGLAAIGGYLRPAGQSLGCVIDTPQLDTQVLFAAQTDEVDMALNAADRLVRWWNESGDEVAAMMKGATL